MREPEDVAAEMATSRAERDLPARARVRRVNAKEKLEAPFDVVAEDTVILPAHDIAYQVGTLAAESLTLFLNDTDGEMDIRLIPRAGLRPP